MSGKLFKTSVYETDLRSAYIVIADQQKLLLDCRRKALTARRQLEEFVNGGERERLTVALASLDSIPMYDGPETAAIVNAPTNPDEQGEPE